MTFLKFVFLVRIHQDEIDVVLFEAAVSDSPTKAGVFAVHV